VPKLKPPKTKAVAKSADELRPTPLALEAGKQTSEWVQVTRDLYLRKASIIFIQQYALDGTTIQCCEGKVFNVAAPLDMVLRGIDAGTLV